MEDVLGVPGTAPLLPRSWNETQGQWGHCSPWDVKVTGKGKPLRVGS